jgi:hypothetical protein
MLTFTNTETRFCSLIASDVEIIITHRDPLLTGIGGLLMPRKAGPIEVDCPNATACSEKGMDCVWAIGVLKTINDPLNLKITF